MTIDFNCNNDYILEDERVLLRPLEEDDYELLLPFALQEPDLWTYSLVSPAGEAGMQSYILQALRARAECREYPFVVYDKKTEQYAGSTRFYDIQPQHKTLQLGYTWYGKAFQRTGLNRHCKYLMLSFAFEDIGMERVEFRADHNNAKSIAAMKAIGCTVEGVLRSNLPMYDGTRRNSIVLSILKEEWFSRVKKELMVKMY
ncbi:GNAT family N-acetyltransferase [Ilyomonas limi]|uniref:GNAT family N-acetyltransferase n=1 Tax=Ilyomonas limi TaxID=2575867 RepID=A0A4U3L728_9BACT|nr:GNAT family protein [Ilyomonas limi]TKK70822.1 GNAT family N-acetyltransferase [Ilyomonas limi]